MRIFLFTSLMLATIQVGHPGPKQQGSPQKHQQESKQGPSQSIVSPITAPPGQPTSDAKESSTAKKAGNVWQKAFPPESWSNWALVIVAVGTAIVALRTLKVIQRHAEAAEGAAETAKIIAEAARKGAEAAGLTAETLQNGERAWLRETGPPQCHQGSCAVFVQNFGNSPAWIESVGGSFRRINSIGELPETPEYGHINRGTALPIRPEDEPSIIKITNEIKSASESTLDNMPSKIAAYVFIRYRDRFRLAPADEPYILRFCYVSESPVLWRKDGPPTYNQAT